MSVAVLLPIPETCRFVGGNGGTEIEESRFKLLNLFIKRSLFKRYNLSSYIKSSFWVNVVLCSVKVTFVFTVKQHCTSLIISVGTINFRLYLPKYLWAC